MWFIKPSYAGLNFWDFGMGYIIVRDGKGSKDRTTLLPKTTIPDLKKQIAVVQKLLESDIKDGVGPVYMPHLLEKNILERGAR